MAGELLVCDLGVIEYRACLALQEDLRDRVATGAAPEVLLLLEHPPVYTLGRRSGPEDLPLGEAFYRERGIDVVHVNRGGKLTFHNRGQLVGYPIMRTDDILAFLRTMEAALIAALTQAGVPAEAGRRPTGVWAQDRKIASIGVHVTRGTTNHGFAVNVDNDLEPFAWAVPCGMPGVRMTSVRAEGGSDDLATFRARAAAAFCAAHGRRAVAVEPEALGAAALPA